jgi:hypothetical protein
MTLKSRKLVRPTSRTPKEDADPLGLFPALSEQLKQTYDAEVRAFLRKFLLVGGLAPAVRRSISAAVTARGRPVRVDFRITFYPPDASGFFRADGELITPVAELARRRSVTSNPTIQNTDRNSWAFSASLCACTDLKGDGAKGVVANSPRRRG